MSTEAKESKVVRGNILLFYAFDVGDDIDFDIVRDKDLVPLRGITPSRFFKNYQIPLSFHMPVDKVDSGEHDSECIVSRFYNFGVLSFCYRVPFECNFNELRRLVLETDETYERLSKRDAQKVYEKILGAIRKPKFFHISGSYMVIQMNPSDVAIPPQEFTSQYGSELATMLRLETEELSDYQIADILDTRTGYYGRDLLIIDSQASFVYDDEYFETLEFFELANIQKVEMQYFDRLLYKQLNFFYSQEVYKIPLRAYIPLIGRRLAVPIQELTKVRVDISVITERLESSISMVGEAYYSNLYKHLVENLSLREWRDSINKKLEIIEDIYTIYQDHLDAVREEILTVVIIILITIEAFVAFIK